MTHHLPSPAPAVWPTGIHPLAWIFEQAGHTWCWVCGAAPEGACTCGDGGVHWARFIRAQQEHRISSTDVMYPLPSDALSGQERLSGATVIPGPEATT